MEAQKANEVVIIEGNEYQNSTHMEIRKNRIHRFGIPPLSLNGAFFTQLGMNDARHRKS